MQILGNSPYYKSTCPQSSQSDKQIGRAVEILLPERLFVEVLLPCVGLILDTRHI